MTTKSTNGRTGTESDVTVDLEDAPPDDSEKEEEINQNPGTRRAEAEDAGSTAADAMGALENKVVELEEKNKQTYDRLLRATADLDNFRKRARREIEDARTDARGKVLLEMLPVIDNLERAMQHAGTGADVKGIAEGVELVLRQFHQALERCDVRALDALGLPFDPNFHEAVGQRESDEYPPGTVIDVMQRGYSIAQRLLRPALVVVSKAASAAEQDSQSEAGRGNGGSPADTPPINGSGTTHTDEEG
jgi:molecular chaperone GrpE